MNIPLTAIQFHQSRIQRAVSHVREVPGTPTADLPVHQLEARSASATLSAASPQMARKAENPLRTPRSVKFAAKRPVLSTAAATGTESDLVKRCRAEEAAECASAVFSELRQNPRPYRLGVLLRSLGGHGHPASSGGVRFNTKAIFLCLHVNTRGAGRLRLQ